MVSLNMYDSYPHLVIFADFTPQSYVYRIYPTSRHKMWIMFERQRIGDARLDKSIYDLATETFEGKKNEKVLSTNFGRGSSNDACRLLF